MVGKSFDVSRRAVVKSGAAMLAAAAFPMPAIAQTKPFVGVTLRGASYQHRFMTILQGYIPEFERETGMKVDLQLTPFPIYNRMISDGFSRGASMFDFVNVTFFLAARWVAAGYLADLEEFATDPNLTPSEWKPDDFVDGAQLPYRGSRGGTFAFAWEGGAMVMGLSRMDLMEKKGLKVPQTFDELAHVCAEINGEADVSGFVTWQLHHWCLMPYLHGFGANVFRDPPADVTPTLDSPNAVKAVEYYVNLLRYAPRGVMAYSEDQACQSMLKGRSNIFIHSSSWVSPILLSDESRVQETSRIVRMPAGPVHDRPASNSQGLGIPTSSKNKAAAWEFIKWALSPEMSMRIVKEHGHATVCRRSVIKSDEYRRINTVNGQDLGQLYLDVLQLPARGDDYMSYRTVKEFPVVGDAVNHAVEMVVGGKLSARDAMSAAQEQALVNLGPSGARL